jgi:hypothetical protein
MGDLFQLVFKWKHVLQLRRLGYRLSIDQLRPSDAWKVTVWGGRLDGWTKRCDGLGRTIAEALEDAWGKHCDLGER